MPSDGGELQAHGNQPGIPGEDPKHDALIGQGGEHAARQLLANPRATVHVASATGVHVGAIVGETPTHWIQRISPNTAVLHDKSHTPELVIGQACTLHYSAGQARLISQTKSPGRGLSR